MLHRGRCSITESGDPPATQGSEIQFALSFQHDDFERASNSSKCKIKLTSSRQEIPRWRCVWCVVRMVMP